MKIEITKEPISKIKADLLCVLCLKNKVNLKTKDKILDDLINSTISLEEFKGHLGEVLFLRYYKMHNFSHVCFVGLGEKENLTEYELRTSAAKLAQNISKAKIDSICFVTHDELLEAENFLVSMLEGFYLGSYKFNKYKKEKDKCEIVNNFIFRTEKLFNLSRINEIKETVETSVSSINYARDLVNEPASFITPSKLVEEAKKLTNENISCTVLNKSEMKLLGMEGTLAVSKGSNEEPKVIKLEYSPKVKYKKHLCIIGKGVTFDSGGLSLKQPQQMYDMKIDMSGAAATLGIFKGLAKIKMPIKITGLVAACENMPSGHAVRPGDVINIMNRKTVEILNTDAEGRLTLADMICYAQDLGATEIIDIATLTSSCVIALGEEVAGVFSNNDLFSKNIIDAGKKVGERMWRMPLVSTYKEHIKSDIAEIKNTGMREGGAISAALFLEEFVKNNLPWIHIDIAGPAKANQNFGCNPKGGTGFSVRTILEYIQTK
jgi:leucyl aminopeptidase